MDMAEVVTVCPQDKQIALPLNIQHLESSLNMKPFLAYAQSILSRPLTCSSADSDSDVKDDLLEPDDKIRNGIVTTKMERHNDKLHIYNLTNVGPDRKWLQDILLSDTESESEITDEDAYVKTMLKEHLKEQKFRAKYYQNSKNSQYGYYGAGLLSIYDKFPEYQRSIVGVRRRQKKTEKIEKIPKVYRQRKPRTSKQQNQLNANATVTPTVPIPYDETELEPGEINWDDQLLLMKHDLADIDDDDDVDDEENELISGRIDCGRNERGSTRNGNTSKSVSGTLGRRGRKKSSLAKTPEVMAARRRKLWQIMSKKELGKVQRAKTNNHKEMLTSCKRVATLCMKIFRHKAMQSQKNMKETVWRAKRLTREMQGYWKRYDRVERETRRRMEKEAEEQRKLDVELIEAKRQQRKLNFLITQTELYAHFMSKKLGSGTTEEQLRILNQLDEEANPRLAAIDDYNSEYMKQMAQRNASTAFNTERARTKQFDEIANLNKSDILQDKKLTNDGNIEELPQPNLFNGVLKTYQIKGMTWLANLYDQGISGILADEMGLGKTVQSIAFLCHIAENYGVWGPFLIISPASTLHNWQQEMQRFIPEFNVVPYWGSPNERKILRQFWEQKDLHTKDASFHVVITSYQLVVTDYKYFNRIKWQYMILDEAQAIKSSSSVRWKLLLGFNCRNRLLLSGTPIQNSMAELWALLHFIMPTLFDSHDEFNEWFSKDIESHAENKTGIDEKQISRLHMILKPFMLRRIKKDVENELSDKIEIMVYCPLTLRQKLLYMALKTKIKIEDLLQFTDRNSGGGGGGSGGGGSAGGGGGSTGGGNSGGSDNQIDKSFTSNLMNLVMQFRKVCNHPELFERRDAKSPFSLKCSEYIIPRLIYDDGLLYQSFPSNRHLLYNRFNAFKSEYVHRRLFPKHSTDNKVNYNNVVDLNVDNLYSFTRFVNLSPIEMERLILGDAIYFLKHCKIVFDYLKLINYRKCWWTSGKNEKYHKKSLLLLEPTIENNLNNYFLSENDILSNFLFTSNNPLESSVYTFSQVVVHSMQETMEHRIIRSKSQLNSGVKVEIKKELIEEFDYNLKTDTSATGLGSNSNDSTASTYLVPEFYHFSRSPRKYECQSIEMPRFLYGFIPKVQSNLRKRYTESRAAQWAAIRYEQCETVEGRELIYNSVNLCRPHWGWSNINVPDKQTLISDSGKLGVLDNLLARLKLQGHRVLIYSQMTRVIDLLEEYMWHRKHRYMRLDGSSKIAARRDMVADFQTRADIFVFLLSTRAGGLGINLTAADTVIFYDSDWNPTVDQQAMDRAHRLGQTKQVTVYRLICKGTIEERIMQRAREKSEIQRMVISGGNFKPDTLKPKEVVSLLLDDEEIELKYRMKTEEKKCCQTEDTLRIDKEKERKRKSNNNQSANKQLTGEVKKVRVDTGNIDIDDVTWKVELESGPTSPTQSELSHGGATVDIQNNDDSSNEALIVDCDSPGGGTGGTGGGGSGGGSSTPVTFNFDLLGKPRRRHNPRGTKRGRPRGSRRGGGTGSLGRSDGAVASSTNTIDNSTISETTQQQTTQTTTTPSSSASSTTASTTSTSATLVVPTKVSTPIRRGPGRPRLKPSGPINQGFRSILAKSRKPIGPLVVPLGLGSSPIATPTKGRSPAMSPAPSPATSNDRNTIYYPSHDDD